MITKRVKLTFKLLFTWLAVAFVIALAVAKLGNLTTEQARDLFIMLSGVIALVYFLLVSAR